MLKQNVLAWDMYVFRSVFNVIQLNLDCWNVPVTPEVCGIQ